MAAGAFSDEFLLRSTEPTQKKKEKKKEEKKMNNLAVPGPRTNARGSNRPFGFSPLTLILVPNYRSRFEYPQLHVDLNSFNCDNT